MPSSIIERYPFVSVIIPTKNEEKNLTLCLDALTKIDYPKHLYEIIVVDNGSVDKTIEIAKKYGVRIFEEPDKKISGLRNLGANESGGSILAFIDADVIVDDKWLENAVNRLNNNNEIACAGSSPDIPVESTWVTKAKYLMVEARGENINTSRKWLTSMNLIIRKDIFFKMGGFNESLITCEDVDFGYRLTKKYQIYYDKKIRAVHLGEPRTLAELFKKEMWRGTSNFQGIRSHGLVLNEIKSLILPVYCFVTLLLFVFSFMAGFTNFIPYILLLIIFPVLLKTSAVIYKTGKYNMFLKFFICFSTYVLARTAAVFLIFKRR